MNSIAGAVPDGYDGAVAHLCYSGANEARGLSDILMPTTTIRLPEELKARVAIMAKCAGTTAHGFMLEAIAEKVVQAEARDDFDAQANARYARITATGETISWAEMRDYLEKRTAGQTPQPPAVRRLTR